MKGRQICCITALRIAAQEKRAVVSDSAAGLRKPRPAAIVINWPAFMVDNIIRKGLWIYDKL